MGRSLPPELIATSSPVLAYAMALQLPFVPFHINIRAKMTPDVLTTQTMSFEGSNERLNMASIIDSVKYTIDAPNSFPGTLGHSQEAWYFAKQSGIQATMIVDGAPRYVVAPFYTPLETLLSEDLAQSWPQGWVLEYTQSVKMQFTQTIPLPSNPVNVTVTFRLWQPGGGQALQLVGMTNDVARDKLLALGIDPAKISQSQ
jgi:hypothetical protein